MTEAENSTDSDGVSGDERRISEAVAATAVVGPPVSPPKEGAGEWPIFVSYRRSAVTGAIAKWLKEELEREPIEAVNGQIFRLNVFVDALEPVHGDFQKYLVPHLQHSRMLIVIADPGSSQRRKTGKDYLYDELDWWARNRPKAAPVLLDTDRISAAALVANDQRYGSWSRTSWLECFWHEWNASPQRLEEEKARLLKVLRESIQTYGHEIHLEEVRRLRRLLKWLTGVTLIATLSAIGIGGLAIQLQRTLRTSEGRLYGLSTNGAAFALKGEDFAGARTTLRESPLALRQWEWNHLWFRADSSQRQWMAHKDGTRGVVYSPDETKLYSVGRDGCLKAWDSTTGRELFAVCTPIVPLRGDAAEQAALIELGIKPRAEPLGPLAISPDGKTLAGGTPRGGLHIWRAEDGVSLASVTKAHEKAVLTIAFFSNDILMTSSEDGRLLAWDLKQSPPIARLIFESSQPLEFCLSPDRKRLTVASSRMSESASPTTAKLFVIDEALQLKQRRQGQISPDLVGGIVYAGDEHSVVAVDYQGDLIFVPESDASPEVRAAVPPRLRGTEPLMSLISTSNGEMLGVGTQSGAILLWNVSEKRPLRVLAGHDAGVSSLCFSSSGRQLASGSVDGQIRLWSAREESAAEQSLTFDFDIWALSVAPDESSFAIAGENGELRILDSRDSTERLHGQNREQARIDWLRYAPDGESLVSIDHRGTLAIWKTATLEETLIELAPENKAKEAFFIGAGEIVILLEDGTLWILDPQDPRQRREYSPATPQPTQTICPLLSSRLSAPLQWRLALARREGSIEIRDDHGTLVRTLPSSPPDVDCMVASPDGTLLAAAALNEIVCWDLASTRVVFRIKQPHEKLTRVMTFSKDSKRLCSGSHDSTCKVWDVAEALCLFQSEPLNGIVHGLGFLNHGRDLIVAPCDSSLRILRGSPAQ